MGEHKHYSPYKVCCFPVTCDWKAIKDDKLDDVVSTPVRTTTLNLMTNRTGTAKETNGDSQFIPALRKPKENEIIKLI